MMTTKHLLVSKNTFLLVFAISLFLFSSCSSYDEDITEIEVTFTDEARISFGKEGGSKTIEVKSNKDWSVVKSTDANWMEVSPTNGLEGIVTLTVNVESNDGEAREGFFTIKASESEKIITITQNGKDGTPFEYVSINEIRSMYASKGHKDWRIAESMKLKGIVISDKTGGNDLSPKEGFLQDESGQGIAFSVTEHAHLFDLGDLLNINLESAIVMNNKGTLQISFSSTKAKVQAQRVIVKPNELTIEEVLKGAKDATLVKLRDVQFRVYENLNYYEGKSNVTNRALENSDGGNLFLTTCQSATFKDKPLPAGKGNIVGIVSQLNGIWQIAIRNLDDVSEMSTDASTRFTIKEPPADEPRIVTDKEIVTFGSKVGNETIHITANVDWTVKSDESWLSITPNSGSNDGTITATATENKGDERNATITITNGKITKILLVTQLSDKESGNDAKDLFFSEYIKGSSYNKYLEIYNGTGRTVDLSDYKVAIYINGQKTAKYIEELTGTLENGKVIVVQHPKATIYKGVAIESTAINFNGNDAIALIKISTESFVDIFGTIGEDPGKAWTTDMYEPYLTTVNSTLIRIASVRSGVTVNPKKGFPKLRVEWIMYPVDTSGYLGSHTMN